MTSYGIGNLSIRKQERADRRRRGKLPKIIKQQIVESSSTVETIAIVVSKRDRDAHVLNYPKHILFADMKTTIVASANNLLSSSSFLCVTGGQ